MIDFLKGTVGKDYFSDRLYGCQECIAEYLASKEPLSQPTNESFTNRFIESRIIWIGSTAGIFGFHITAASYKWHSNGSRPSLARKASS